MKLGDYILSVKLAVSLALIIVVFVAGALVALFQLRSIDDVAAASGAPLAPGRSTGAPSGDRALILQVRNRVESTLGTAIAVSAIIALTTGIWVIRSVSLPIHGAAVFAQRVSGGDLTGRIQSKRRDEIGWLFHELHQMTKGLKRIVMEVRSGMEVVAGVVHELAAQSADLSRRAAQRAASLEESASSMEELASTVKGNADSARKGHALAKETVPAAVLGRTHMDGLSETMGAISARSNRIVESIDLIESIASQTHVLAINASIEAARAGVHGRGFSVVATEVRTLAQKAAAASQEVRTLVLDARAQIDQGSAAAGQMAATIDQIVNSVQRLADLSSEIADASAQQAVSTAQVSEVIWGMQQGLERDAESYSRAATAVGVLEARMVRLVDLVDRFKFDDLPSAGPSIGGQAIAAAPPPVASTAP
jgi:methyl-accepting chemotaxis protein